MLIWENIVAKPTSLAIFDNQILLWNDPKGMKVLCLLLQMVLKGMLWWNIGVFIGNNWWWSIGKLWRTREFTSFNFSWFWWLSADNLWGENELHYLFLCLFTHSISLSLTLSFNKKKCRNNTKEKMAYIEYLTENNWNI